MVYSVGDSTSYALVGKLKDVVKRSVENPLGYVVNWGRLYSLWPVHMETGCCSVELGAASGSRWDIERFGVLEAFGSLRQCDLLIVLGTVTRKMMPRLRVVWEQMPEPKWCIAIGACSISGGLYLDSYNVMQGIDQYIPVDVKVPGCPPSTYAIIDGIMLLMEKIRRSDLKGHYPAGTSEEDVHALIQAKEEVKTKA
ncbi:MAG: NADH-quinone oxidoreductase subunit NuoB [Nitrososphaerota archaeon]